MHIFSLKHPFSTPKVAQLFLDNVIKLYGTPKSLVTDRDKVFTSGFWKSLFQALNIKLALTTAYHPQTDGQSERVNQCLEMYLRCAIHETPNLGKKCLHLAEFWYNSSYHTALGCSPFKALYGHDPVFAAAPMIPVDGELSVAEWVKERQSYSEFLKESLASAQNRMKVQADKNRTERSFQGEMVLLKLQPYVQSSVVNRPCPKLAFKFFGPFKVLQKIGKVAYKLDLLESAKIHPVFPVSQLKPFTPSYTPVYVNLSSVVDLTGVEIYPMRVLERRLVRKGSHPIVQVRLSWCNLPESATTWEDFEVLKKRFPEVIDWGNQFLSGERCKYRVIVARVS